MVADFQSEYGIRLIVSDLSWVEFFTLLIGLLVVDSRLQRHINREPDSVSDTVE